MQSFISITLKTQKVDVNNIEIALKRQFEDACKDANSIDKTVCKLIESINQGDNVDKNIEKLYNLIYVWYNQILSYIQLLDVIRYGNAVNIVVRAQKNLDILYSSSLSVENSVFVVKNTFYSVLLLVSKL